jgi:hypothetical protein
MFVFYFSISSPDTVVLSRWELSGIDHQPFECHFKFLTSALSASALIEYF